MKLKVKSVLSWWLGFFVSFRVDGEKFVQETTTLPLPRSDVRIRYQLHHFIFFFHRSLPFLREIKTHKNSVDQKFNTSFSVGVSMHCVYFDEQLPWKILQNRNILHLRHVFMVTYLNHLCTCGLFFLQSIARWVL